MTKTAPEQAGAKSWAQALFAASAVCFLFVWAEPDPYIAAAGLAAFLAGAACLLVVAFDASRPPRSSSDGEVTDAAVMGGGEFKGP